MEQRLGMPATVHGFFAGTAQAYQDSLATEKYLVITALLAVFIVLGILYESLVHPTHHHFNTALGQRRRHAGAHALSRST